MINLVNGRRQQKDLLEAVTQSWAFRLSKLIKGSNPRRVTLNSESTRSDIIGFPYINPQSGDIEYVPNALVEGDVVLIDEIDKAPAEILANLSDAFSEKKAKILNREMNLGHNILTVVAANSIDNLPGYIMDRAIASLYVPSHTTKSRADAYKMRGNTINPIFDADTVKALGKLISQMARFSNVVDYASQRIEDVAGEFSYNEAGSSIIKSARSINAVMDISKTNAWIRTAADKRNQPFEVNKKDVDLAVRISLFHKAFWAHNNSEQSLFSDKSYAETNEHISKIFDKILGYVK